MRYRRRHMRVPASGDVFLSDLGGVKVKASIVNISVGGLCITALEHQIDHKEYQIQVRTLTHGKIHFSGVPVYQNINACGIRITAIEKDQLEKIHQVVENFQTSEDFVKYIGEKDIIHDWLVDRSGDDIAITFETEGEKNR